MATHTFVEFELPEAATFAAMSGVRADPASAMGFCDYLEQAYAAGRPPMEVVDALSTAIVVRYFRGHAG